MCGTSDHDHDGHDHDHHEHDHDHVHGHECCSYGEDYERNLAEQRALNVSRRDLLKSFGAAGLLIAGNGIHVGDVFASDSSQGPALQPTRPYNPQGSGEFDGFYYLSGDHHIHTRYSPDAKYAVQRQVAEANYHGLDWMVITDHGGATHNKISVDLTYPDIVRAREAFPNMLVYTGLEMNIPGAEHGTVMLQPNPQEKDQIKQFEAAYDASIAPNTEETALEGLRWLDRLQPKPLFFANHPARRGLDSPHEIRNWKAAAPEVAMGFEGAPGHQAAGLLRDAEGRFTSYRGFYGNRPGTGAFPGYPLESYFTYGGFDWMTAKLGGVWDSLLGDGLRWWITANSDSHRYYSDLQDVDSSQYNTLGYVTEADRYFLRPSNGDFRPGEYSRTYAVAQGPTYADVMTAMRGGSSFVVHGDLIDRLKFTAETREGFGRNRGDLVTAGMGGTLTVRRGGSVRISISVRIPSTPNWNNQRPLVDHIDLISGDVNKPSETFGLDAQSNPSTRVAARFRRAFVRRRESADGLTLSMEWAFGRIDHDFYIRLRGTNTTDTGSTPALDPDTRGQTGKGESPWDDLWFYSNPIFIRVAS